MERLHVKKISLIERLKAREGRIEKTDTQTDTQENYCNPPRTCTLRVNNAIINYTHNEIIDSPICTSLASPRVALTERSTAAVQKWRETTCNLHE